jgi:hypothetical protein
MTQKIYYEKHGRRYVPVRELDNDLVNSMPKGTHIVMCHPGGTSTHYNIDPAYAPMIAAGRVAEDAISAAIMKATALRQNYRMRQRPLTPEQKAAWEHLVEVFGDEAKALEWPSAREAAEEAVKAFQREADELLKHESVKQAYDHFMMMCELTKEHK